MPQPTTATATRLQDMPLASLQMAVRNVRRAAPDPSPDATAQRADAPAADPAALAPAARFEIVFSTGAPVKRWDYANGRYYLEQLEVSDTAINLSRLQRGAPLLNTHYAWDLEAQLGVCDQPEIRDGQGICQTQLSRRDSVKGVVQDLEDGVIRNVSVGYARDAIEMLAPGEDNDMWVYRVTRWTPMEVSLVPIPADMDSQVVRSASGTFKAPDGRELRAFPCAFTGPDTAPQQSAAALAQSAAAPQTTTAVATAETRNHPSPTGAPMPNENTGGTTATATTTQVADTRAAPGASTGAPGPDAAHQAGMQAERQRSADIRTAAQAARSTLGAEADALAIRLIDAGVGVDEARKQIIDALAEASTGQAVRGAANVRTERDEVDTLRKRMSDALVLRTNPRATDCSSYFCR